MRVAWFGHSTRKRGNGLVRYSRQLIEGLEARGTHVTFFYHRARGEDSPLTDSSIGLRALSLWDHDLLSSPTSLGRIEKTLVAEGTQIAHVSLSFSNLDFSLPGLCHRLGIPVVATFHAPYDRRPSIWGVASRSLYRLWSSALAGYDAVVIFSHQQTEILTRCGVDGERIHVIPNGVDTSYFRPGPSTFKEEVGADLLVVYCGRLDPEKNVGTLLDVFRTLNPESNCKAVIVGNGVESDRLRRRHEGNNALFTGLVQDSRELLRILQAGDVFVLPSEVEGLSIAMLEAMACGMATVATDVGSDGEALEGAGIAIDPQNLRGQLDLALRLLVENPELRLALGRNARRRVVSRYSLQRNIDQVVKLYENLLSAGR
jgi:glycosyltransferase involved in cell wall biosynthesis